jgi:hypothetical protein
MAVRRERALWVVWGSEELPWTVEIPRGWREGWCAVKRMANASYFLC